MTHQSLLEDQKITVKQAGIFLLYFQPSIHVLNAFWGSIAYSSPNFLNVLSFISSKKSDAIISHNSLSNNPWNTRIGIAGRSREREKIRKRGEEEQEKEERISKISYWKVNRSLADKIWWKNCWASEEEPSLFLRKNTESSFQRRKGTEAGRGWKNKSHLIWWIQKEVKQSHQPRRYPPWVTETGGRDRNNLTHWMKPLNQLRRKGWFNQLSIEVYSIVSNWRFSVYSTNTNINMILIL